jgi:hypothetical protein
LQVANAAGLLGVQKPGKPGATNPHTAATEKIVADLAHVIGLPVPPVTLWDRGATTGEPRYVAVSVWAFASPLTWAQGSHLLTPQQRELLIPLASAMIPFEMWIDAQDRQNDGNVLVDGNSQPDQVRAGFPDFPRHWFAQEGGHERGCRNDRKCRRYPSRGHR